MSFSDDIAFAKRTLHQGDYQMGIGILKEITPLGLDEKKRIRETYMWAGNLAYERKDFSVAIKAFQGAKSSSITHQEEVEASQRIYFTLFVYLYQTGKNLYDQEKFVEANAQFERSLSSIKRFPKEKQAENKAYEFMESLRPSISQYIHSCKNYIENQKDDHVDTKPSHTLTNENPIPEKQPISPVPPPSKLDDRTRFKQAIIAGKEWFKAKKFEKALAEFQTAKRILPTDELQKLSIKCQRGIELTQQLDKLKGSFSSSHLPNQI